MKINRKIVTPIVTFIFLLIGVTGIMMFFHVFDGFIEVLHEIAGLAFVIFSILHVIVNWKSLKNLFKNKSFIITGVLTLIISTTIIFIAKGHNEHKRIIIEKLVEAPIEETFYILDIDKNALELLENKDILIGSSTTINEVGINNGIKPEEVLEILLK